MASSPFELDDQTDEDFFDKLVDDDDDVIVGPGAGVGVGSSAKVSPGLAKVNDGGDSDESDEVKAFANLSVSEVGIGGGDFGKSSVSEVDNGSSDPVNLSIGEFDNGKEGKTSGDDVGGDLQSVRARGELVADGEVSSSLVSSDSFSFGNGQAVEDGVVGSEVKSGLSRESSGFSSGGVKEVQWSAFSDSAENGSGGFGLYDDFFTGLDQGAMGNVQIKGNTVVGDEAITNTATESSYSHVEQTTNGVDTNSVEFYESQYPGWKYDPNTGQWYQLDTTVGNANVQENVESTSGNVLGTFGTSVEDEWAVSDVKSSQVSYSQPFTQSVVGTITEQKTTIENVSGWNDNSQQNGEYQYPAHMIFDPQYPGWYYDTLAQNWLSLEAYHSSGQATGLMGNSQMQNGSLGETYSHGNSQGSNDNRIQVPGSEGLGVNQNWGTTFGHFSEPGSNDRKSASGMQSGPAASFGVDNSWSSSQDANGHYNHQKNPRNFFDSRGTGPSSGQTNHQQLDSSNWLGGVRSFGPSDNTVQQFNHSSQVQQNGLAQYPTDAYNGQDTAKISQPFYINGNHAPIAPSPGRSSAGRPPHALVTFGFGGKLVVMKDTSTVGFSMYGNQDAGGHSLSVLNLMEAVGVKNDLSGTSQCVASYFHSLCHQSFPGPLVGGSAGSKELNKWLDESIAVRESMGNSDGNGEAPKLLLSLLKVACQHYGKLRSFGTDAGVKENDLPESAVANLFASAKKNNVQFGQYNTIANCLMTLPSEQHMQVTASEVQQLLISGRKREALQCAQEGQFWGFALILARELGDQFYTDTVKQMAVSQLVAGSPLRTLCLLIAKKPEEVFSNGVMSAGNLPGVLPQSVQNAGYSMVDNWEENLAVITANRTENDHLVVTHLGDCLWKDKNNVTAAHICYLVAEADFELYSDTARLCLIGADHWNFPRTFASPEAIQRTELFEYAKVLGNSQFVLLPLQPYKLIYAHMLAEVGRVSDSLKYCQAVYKSLKTARSPEADTLRQLVTSLEERNKTHQQSGYAANLAPAKIVGKLLNFFDSTAHRVVGGLPPPVPAGPNGFQGNDHNFQTPVAKSTNGQYTLGPSASMEAINQWTVDGSKITAQSRSSSESDIGRSPGKEQVDTSNEATAASTNVKKSVQSGTSRFGLNFGSQIFQKTVGLVLKPRQGRQAKLGDTNKFYYDEKLKRWVEEGAAAPAEEAALPPPPKTAVFQTNQSDYNSNNGLSTNGGSPEPANSTPPSLGMTPPSLGMSPPSLGMAAGPPSSNQFSARGRMGVRSRYVDTFNKGGSAPTNMFQAPSVPSVKPANLPSAKFFIPTAASPSKQTYSGESGSTDDAYGSNEQSSSSPLNDPFQNLAPSPAATMQRFPSVDNIPNKGITGGGNSFVGSQSRRIASWSAMHNTYTPPSASEVKASPLSFMPSNQSSGSLHNSGGSFGDDLQEVEL